MHVMPVWLALAGVVIVPAIAAFRLLVCAVAQTFYEITESLFVVRMDIGVTHLDAYVITEHGFSVQVEHTVLPKVETHHVVSVYLEGHHHGLLLIKHLLRFHLSVSLMVMIFSFQ